VYFTLGTVFPQESGDLFARVLAGISSLPVDVLVTVGDEIGPAELGNQPPNVRIEGFLPLADVLAESDVVVSHGGSGTVVAALALGLPQVLLPMGADQPLNADRCTELGIAVALDAMTSTATEIAEATCMALYDPSYRANVRPLREEAASQPDAGHAASLLKRLAWSRSPVTTD
jgi:MGT family glycosyltransferase